MGAVISQDTVKQILELREQNLGYREIAYQTGLTRDAVRNLCRKYEMGGYRARPQTTPKNACPNCGKPVVDSGAGRKRRFCSEYCRRRWWKLHRDAACQNDTAVYHFQCECCKQPFTAYGNRNRKFCSRSCYIQERFHSACE